MKIFLPLLAALSAVNDGGAARILAGIATPSYSHQVFFQMLWRELALRGHHVVVLTTDPTRENLTNLREIDMSSMYTVRSAGVGDLIRLNDNKMAAYKYFVRLYIATADYGLALPEVQALIKDETQHFDLVMLEYLFPSFYAFKHRFNCPFIGVISLDGINAAHEAMGNPSHAVLYPNSLFKRTGAMGFKERLTSFLLNQITTFLRTGSVNAVDEMNRRHFGEGYPNVQELADSVDMLFVNDNPMFADVRPTTPATISIAGGIHMKAPKELPHDLRKFMDASVEGVVYFSLGSNVKCFDLSNATLRIFLETFSELPYNVLWKCEADVLREKPRNVKIIKWAPQQDVLRHRNVKLFVTQAGVQSLEEALFSHVPLITLPFFADQDANAAKVAQKGLGLNLDHKTLSVKEFKASIVEVITNPKYKENIKRLALQIQDQPMTPLERAVWWTEYMLRHKTGKHLKGRNIPLYQYYYLDVLAFLGVILIAAMLLIYYSCRLAYNFAVNFAERVTTKKKEE